MSDYSKATDDGLYNQAVRLVVESDKASTSLLQRRLRLGYLSAAAMIDAMQKEGVVSAPDGLGQRTVLRQAEAPERDSQSKYALALAEAVLAASRTTHDHCDDLLVMNRVDVEDFRELARKVKARELQAEIKKGVV